MNILSEILHYIQNLFSHKSAIRMPLTNMVQGAGFSFLFVVSFFVFLRFHVLKGLPSIYHSYVIKSKQVDCLTDVKANEPDWP